VQLKSTGLHMVSRRAKFPMTSDHAPGMLGAHPNEGISHTSDDSWFD
jgi:hypothetical protein